MSKNYTGREIAIFTDSHGLLEPTKAALEDMYSRGITEIYSLGDNIGVGPNPREVLELLVQYNVQSLAGNAEEYVTLGIEPFKSYFNCCKKASQLWTLSKLTEEQIGYIKLFPRYVELSIGGKKLLYVILLMMLELIMILEVLGLINRILIIAILAFDWILLPQNNLCILTLKNNSMKLRE